MRAIVGSYSLSEFSFQAGTRKIYIYNWTARFDYSNVLSIYVNRAGSGNDSFTLAESGRWFCTIKQIDSTTYLVEYTHAFPLLKNGDGIQINVNIKNPQDVYITDQSSPIISIFAINVTSTPILASATTVNSNYVYLEAGHGCSVGNYLNFYGFERFNQSKIIGLTGNTIQLNSPMDVVFSVTGTTIECGIKNMAVDGSSINKLFTAKPTEGTDWHINEIVFYIEDSTSMDGSKFGGIAALNRGVLVRKKDGDYDNIFEISSNADFDIYGVLKYDDRSSGVGEYSLVAKLKLNDSSTYGAVIELLNESNDELEIRIQDDLTGLDFVSCSIHGHVVSY